ncbi:MULTISPECIES: carbohydrate ABC transporter permease [unclassified Actinobaculum]|uniref:carbohydrate ABC transporter permease n=1 Tax=unclassified Actinobaculum TaxID=2609299 RepID=UPI000D528EC1|nr:MULTISPECIES: carbohydrate ABC transporter permease [unclassified Actinobaculum]AWE42194.1 sugar ABC transporter permease [Actinobaculum sp. 313]RTE50757.1 carbohydrate ABC transporter permease [Actinobaculum sp. 352]
MSAKHAYNAATPPSSAADRGNGAAAAQVDSDASEQSRTIVEGTRIVTSAHATVQPVSLHHKGRSIASRLVGFINRGAVNVVLIIVAVMWMLPTFGLLVSSLRTNTASEQSGWWTAFGDLSQLTLDNYARRLSSPSFARALLNTVLIVVPSTFLVVALGAMAGYALAWIRFRGRDWVLVATVALMAVPLQVSFIPLARLFRDMHIFGTRWAVILFHTAFGLPFAVYLLRNFFRQIPAEMLEAARIDGANELYIFGRICLPLALPSIASLTIFQFLWSWNDMLVALIFAGANDAPITVELQKSLRNFSANIDLLSSGAFLSMLVPLLVFFAFQRYFVNALMAGSTK